MDTILALQRGVFLVDLMPSSIRLKILYKFKYKVYVIISTVILQPFSLHLYQSQSLQAIYNKYLISSLNRKLG
ncbi:MAG: hypothetical protein MUO21_11050, partial [Nitrososphaeraceae archaeon]|nr:hypothetical protein [Nitrososphaeraceae archaeon]